MGIAYCVIKEFKLVDLLQYFSLWSLEIRCCVVLLARSDSKEHAASIFRFKMCRE